MIGQRDASRVRPAIRGRLAPRVCMAIRDSLALWLCPALVALLLGTLPAAAQLDHSFMPKGGNTLLQQVFAQAPATELRAVLTGTHTAAEWQDILRPRTGALTDREQRTLATYLAENMPLPADAADRAVTAGNLAAVLPPDGDELAWDHCQNCHSLFTGYLMQDRDIQGWRSIFLSPFHREIPMTGKQRETFAGYSSINMPMKAQDVPPDLRF